MTLSLTRKEAAAKIMVGLDKPDAEAALQVASRLEGTGCWVKVGMELFYAAGHEIVRELKKIGFKIFLDLKMHDIPNTVRGGARSIARMGVDMFNVHAAGGSAMMQAAMQGVNDAVEAGEAQSAPLVIAVTQLTSTSRETLNGEIGIAGSVEEAVVRYAVLAKHAGLQGVVASPLEVEAIKAACGEGFLTVTPGIRPAGAALGDQARVTTPREAVDGGTDYLVIGRPIVAEPDPAQALESILKELTES
ncbi:orotidine-5'-phosphate decarboxylase [Cohnella ginsengisoli]|uniref:Orotidine 5'-phosphate decarboxylase n=1 Tax=Cohnella ginsengisoli TaxID=425004 RepID=A0A9X4KJD5_9BACL|nr:orotidine-5'-phosphate decarboxylase [Cohnella ginsengisoli]MDG0793304.1 orotidine-5'-phosphate decarboxylase [Cohnella ginsengisoli]